MGGDRQPLEQIVIYDRRYYIDSMIDLTAKEVSQYGLLDHWDDYHFLDYVNKIDTYLVEQGHIDTPMTVPEMEEHTQRLRGLVAGLWDQHALSRQIAQGEKKLDEEREGQDG